VSPLAAVARCIVPHAFADPARGQRLVDAINARIGALGARKRRDLGLAIALVGSRFAALVTGSGTQPFAALTADAQARVLDRLIHSRVPLLRTAVQAVRRLILLVEYGTPEAQQEVGYRGPYHSRAPGVAWEGALRGAPTDAEPVARALEPGAAHHPPAAPARLAPLAPSALDGSTLRADAVVIGTGAGGAVAAARLAEAGLDVLILEAGELVSGVEFDEREAPLFQRLYADGGLRTTDDVGVSIVQGVSVGGSTTVNWMIMLRTPEWVLDEWTERHGAEGMRPAEMAPLFDRIERETHARRVSDDAHSPNNRVILDGARALGWSAHSAMINAHDCVRTGFCGYGCRTGAKQDALRTYLPRALDAGARLLTRARATRIEILERAGAFPKKRITAQVADGRGAPREITIETPIVVVAGGAVETPLLLQRSALGGPAVGRYLRLHPTTGLFARFDREIYPAAGIPLSAVCDEFHRLDANGYGVWIECPPLHPALGASSLPGFGATHREHMLAFRQTSALIILARDGAERDRSNGEVRARRDGSASIRYALSSADAAHLETGLVAAAKLQFAAGALSVCSGHSRPITLTSATEVEQLRGHPLGANQLALFSAHVNGTCRLGTNPRTAGADPNGEVFGARGVFVADGSLLPTAPGVNPQETIMALATHVSERIASRWRTR